MKTRFILFCLFSLIGFASNTQAKDADFITRVNFYMQEINPNYRISVEFVDTQKIPESCPFPIFDLPNKRKTWGKISLRASCENKKTLIPINVIAYAPVAVSISDIARGEALSPQNITIFEQDITQLNVAPVTDIGLLFDAQSLRLIPKDTIITFPMVKRAWVIKAGDTVSITMTGNGFSANNMGKAINNAYKGDKVRIRLENKSIIEGVALGAGKVQL